MPDNSPILALPYLQPGQAQKHVTHNEALRRLDLLVQLSVAGFGAETPPADPAEGELHALGPAPTGGWAGQANALAAWLDGTWHFIAPQEGWRAWGRAEADLRVWSGGAWVQPHAALDDLDRLGIGTAADAVNRLAVKSEAVLLSHDGADHRVKINKAAATDTGSVLFQSGWTGHAEIGLAGDTDLSVKVSGDGSAWTEALRIDGAGNVGVGIDGPAERLHLAGNLALPNAAAVKWNDAAGSPQTVLRVDGTDIFTIRGAGGARALEVEGNGGGVLMTVKDAGGVGIGSANPSVPLEVAGQCWIGGAYMATTAQFSVRQDDNTYTMYLNSRNASQTGTCFLHSVGKAGAADFNFASFNSNSGNDAEFRFRGDGNGSCDGSWTGGGADYAEFFEWADGNPKAEDRRGLSVALDGDRIRPARRGDTPIGVISANPSVIGDGDMDRWKGKYLRDGFGSYVWEEYEAVEWTEGEELHSCAADAIPEGVMVPKDAARTVQRRRALNPDHDPDRVYVPRADRPEWATVGLMGKLRLRKGQPVGTRWTRMREVSAEVEEWLVR